MVQTTVLPVSTVFLIALMTMAAARASSPDVGSSMKMMEGLATSSTAIVSLFLCSVDNPLTPGNPTNASFKGKSSTSSITSSINICRPGFMC
uniref:Secreted protein n=1 Tax=Arundo donax TaxID=35708 RepID=A0A0A9C7A4_ARUDO